MQQATHIGAGLRVDGDFRGDGDVVVAGRLDGSVSTSGTVTVLHGGLLLADVTAQEVRVEGVLEGDVRVARRVSIGPQGVLTGHVQGNLSIDDGGTFRGTVDQDSSGGPAASQRAPVTTQPSATAPRRRRAVKTAPGADPPPPSRRGGTSPASPSPSASPSASQRAAVVDPARSGRAAAVDPALSGRATAVDPARSSGAALSMDPAASGWTDAADDPMTASGRRRRPPLGFSETGSVRSLVGLPPGEEGPDAVPLTEWTASAPGVTHAAPPPPPPPKTRRAAPSLPAPRRPQNATTNPSAARPEPGSISSVKIPTVADPLQSLSMASVSMEFEPLEEAPPRRLDATDSGVHPSVEGEPAAAPKPRRSAKTARKAPKTPAKRKPAKRKPTRKPAKAPARKAAKARPAQRRRRPPTPVDAAAADDLSDEWFEDPDFLVKDADAS